MNDTIHRPLLERARREPDRPLVRGRSRTTTFRELADRAARIGAHLIRAGVRPGDRIGLCCAKTVHQMAAVYGISLAGAVTVFLNPLLRREQIEEAVREVRMTGLVSSPEKLRLAAAGLDADLPLRFLMPLKAPASLPEGLALPVQPADEPIDPPPAWPRRISEDPAAIIFTSGSTGRPKGTVLSHRHLLKAGAVSVEHLGIRPDDRILNVLPLCFDYGLSQLLMSVDAGALLVLHTYLTPQALAAALVADRITVLQVTPVVWGDLLSVEDAIRQRPPPALRLLTNSGAHLPVAYGRRLRALFPRAAIVLMYGMTETFRTTYLPPEAFDRRPDSIGKALPDVEVFVVNERGEPCRPGEVGELVHRGATRLLGYWGDPAGTAERLRPHPFAPPGLAGLEPVVYTGDLVRTDEEGFLYFVGRKDHLIKSAGYRIGPEEVEEALLATGLVREAGVHGVPDRRLGQKIRAHVVPARGEVDARRITAAVTRKLPRYMVPHEVIVRASLPRTANGKVDRSALIHEGAPA